MSGVASPVSRDRRPRVAVVLSHPVQYYAPWFQCLAARGRVDLRVFYLWGTDAGARRDVDFGVAFEWDVPLLEGYAWEAVDNVAVDPGSHHFNGLDNPGIVEALAAWTPDMILMFGYAYRSHLRVLGSPRLRRVPKVLRGDSHELAPRTGMRARVLRVARRLLFSRFAAALAVGQANRAYLRASGLRDGQIVVAPHCVDNARFRAMPDATRASAQARRAALGIEPGDRVVLFVGKFEDKKRPQDLLEAYARVPDACRRGTRLVLAGDGALLALLQRQVRRLGLERSVDILPFQNQSAMPSLYAMADLLVLPSFGSGETWGLCVNEAMNLAVPAIVSTHVGCGPDLVRDDVTGWTFRAGDIAALTRVLEHALGLDRAALAAMGQRARDHVAGWSYEAASEALETLAARVTGAAT